MARHNTAVADGKGNKLTTKKIGKRTICPASRFFFVIVVIPLI